MTEESARTARLRALTLNHRIASLPELERAALTPAAAFELCRDLLARGVGAVPLSTCHRTELYWESAGERHDLLAEASLRAGAPGPWPTRKQSVMRLRGEAAKRHLLRVAAGLESALLGETEVLGQIRAGFEMARSVGLRTPGLVELFRDALRFGRLARAKTRIAQGALSVASAAVHLLRRTHPDLSRCTVLVVGAGKVGRKVIRHLAAERVGRCVVLNRTLARAEAAAAGSGALAAPLADLPVWLAKATAVVLAAHADTRLITTAMARAARDGTDPSVPLVIMDASLPRAVDPEVAEIAGVSLQDLSTLEALVEENRVCREAEIPRVEALLEDLLRRGERREQRRLAWERGGGPAERAG